MELEGFVGRSTGGKQKGKESGVVREWPYHDAGLTPVKEGEKEKGLGRKSLRLPRKVPSALMGVHEGCSLRVLCWAEMVR